MISIPENGSRAKTWRQVSVNPAFGGSDNYGHAHDAGQRRGAYAARFPSDGFGLSGDPAWPFYFALSPLIIAILAFAASGVLSARIVRAFRSFERAAERIAKGDLGSPVTAYGIREISALASAMESMRKSLRENTSRRARLLTGISHDLRTPLTSIKGFLEAIEDGLADDPAMLRRYLFIMAEKTEVLEERITELLEFARIDTGEWRLRLEDLELASFIKGLAVRYTEDAKAQKRNFVYSIRGIDGITVRADERMLSRALENIFTNALRYTPEGSTIRLSTLNDGDSVRIEISDNGPGIPSHELSDIFEPWFRGKTFSGVQSGLGLGLSIARSIVNDHGWELGARSVPGGGSRFTVRIPRLSENC